MTILKEPIVLVKRPATSCTSKALDNITAESIIPLMVTAEAAIDFDIQEKICEAYIGGIPALVHFVPCSTAVKKAYLNPIWKELKEVERKKRCPVRGKKGRLIRCPDGTDCDKCPYGYNEWNRKPIFSSLNELVEQGCNYVCREPMEDQVHFRIMFEESIKKLRSIDEELAVIFILLSMEYTYRDVAAKIGKSQSTVTCNAAYIRTVLYDYWHEDSRSNLS